MGALSAGRPAATHRPSLACLELVVAHPSQPQLRPPTCQPAKRRTAASAPRLWGLACDITTAFIPRDLVPPLALHALPASYELEFPYEQSIMAALTRQPLATLHRESLHSCLLISQNRMSIMSLSTSLINKPATINSPPKRKAPTDENRDPTLSKKLRIISDSYLASFPPLVCGPPQAQQTPAAKQARSSPPSSPKRRLRPICIKPLPFLLAEVLGATPLFSIEGKTCGYGARAVERASPSWLFHIY